MGKNWAEQPTERIEDRAINGFYYHFIIFAAVLAVLAAINLGNGGHFWVHWVALGWGLGIIFHAYMVFVARPRREADLRALRQARRDAKAASNPPAQGAG